MQGNPIPPILTEAADAGSGSAGPPPPADLVSSRSRPAAGDRGGGPPLIRDPSLLRGLRALRQATDPAAGSQQELVDRLERRERELTARLDQTQKIVEAGRADLARLQKLHDEQQISLNLQQEQHQSQLQGLQASLAQARQANQRALGDLHELRQRHGVLEQELDRKERWCHDLEQQLQTAREQLGSRGAELEELQRRCEELEQQSQHSDGDTASRLEDLEQQLHAAQDQLGSRGAELEELQRRCEELERQGNASRTDAEPDSGASIPDPEMERLRDELIAVQQMLEDLPDIYEHKFRQRLQPLLEQRDWLLHENSWLRAELPPPRPELPAALESGPDALAEAAPRFGLSQRLQVLSLFGRLGRRLQGSVSSQADRTSSSRAAVERPGADFSDQPDDGPPTGESGDPTHR